jgi:Tol biopolymer transport system component
MFLFGIYSFAGNIEIVSVNNSGVQGNDSSWVPSMSADGKYVTFYSWAKDLVNDDNNNSPDIFVYNRVNNTIKRINMGLDGKEANNYSFSPKISLNGKFVVFESYASNLVENDGSFNDIFVFNMINETINKVSVGLNGSNADNNSSRPSISADGRYIAFDSNASNLVENDSNKFSDIFVYDRETNKMERISMGLGNEQSDNNSYNPFISADGRYVVFDSDASNLVANDHNKSKDIFIYDRQTHNMERVSVSPDGNEANGNSYSSSYMSADNRYVVFSSDASNLVSNDNNQFRDIFVFDRINKTVKRISKGLNGSEANENSYTVNISADGRYIAFQSNASNLVPDDNNQYRDIFIYNMLTEEIERVSLTSNDEEANGNSYYPFVSADGRFITFDSSASNLVPNDTNGKGDIFVTERNVKSQQSAVYSSSAIHVPCFILADNSYWIDLRVINFQPLKFQLINYGKNLYISDNSYCSSFNFNSHILHIPVFEFESKSYWLDLKLISNDLTFTLDKFGKN